MITCNNIITVVDKAANEEVIPGTLYYVPSNDSYCIAVAGINSEGYAEGFLVDLQTGLFDASRDDKRDKIKLRTTITITPEYAK